MTNAHRLAKDALYEQFARVGKAVSAPKRLELLDLLCQGPRSVEALAQQADISIANASQHLKVLRNARLADTIKRGTFVEYRLAGDDVSRFFLSLRNLAESRLTEIEQAARDLVGEPTTADSVDRVELLRRVRSGEVTILDVRPAEEFRAGHIAGAISIPLAEIETRLKELPKRKQIVAYCRGPYCVMAVEAVELLRRRGYKAFRMDDGIADWRARGWRVEAESTRTAP